MNDSDYLHNFCPFLSTHMCVWSVDLWSFWKEIHFPAIQKWTEPLSWNVYHGVDKDTNSIFSRFFFVFLETKLHRLHTLKIICRTVTFPRSGWWFFTICFKYFLIYFLFIWLCFLFGIYFYLKVKQYCSFLISFHGYFHHLRVSCALVNTLRIKFHKRISQFSVHGW